ncbi:amino acid/amide ABC transporter substrate-binding protein, HAAT family (TC 3.A.1.4.-) [Geodermatophilus obscurus]|uniref:Amino acid/amide ABC transporter substrate-binding protein, HAAT family (TC 3.A.1.4.-) n=1 Tax=Geodermatophilus obscurus TaxID=1861 RepID=A0A1M7V061_9ACTN|nr:substrate-binding domain-containing protein [Geodermatophilus obscurus]SHN88577.1 amino acid/amide ABC transporter substrate-binding protein, HAAT family (TC 3.A.1.4.-) [Geodermatophilus obscurus]
MSRSRSRSAAFAVTAAGLLAATAACGSPTASSGGGGGGGEEDGAPVQVGLVTSISGPLAAYGEQYLQGFEACLDHATDGTDEVAGRPIEIVERDDAGDPAKAVAEVTDLIGQGVQVIAGSASSGVATQVAPLAEQNDVLFISGPAATDAITGVNDNTFRSGRQTYQDVLTAQSFIGDPAGQTVLVFAQDSAFGQANVAAVTAVLGEAGGATVTPLLVPTSATDLTPFAAQARDAGADLTFVAWAGETAPAMWQAMGQQGVFDATSVVTGLDLRASYPTYGDQVAGQLNFLSHFFAEAVDNEVSQAMTERVEAAGGEVDIFTPDGCNAAQMVVRAVEEGGDDVAGMIGALEGWTFEGVKGELTIRAEDHALLQPMFQARLEQQGGEFVPVLVETLDAEATAPPVATP